MERVFWLKQKNKGKDNETVGDYIHFYNSVPKHVRTTRMVSIAVHKKLTRNVTLWEETDGQIMNIIGNFLISNF